MTPTLDEIEARLNAATPGPWHLAIWCDDDGVVDGYSNVEAGNRDVANECRDNDADFIAHAPDDISHLLRLVRERDARLAEIADIALDSVDGDDPVLCCGTPTLKRIHALATKEGA